MLLKKYTKGRWIATGRIVHTEDGITIASFIGGAMKSRFADFEVESEANTKAIAAAPEMIKALEGIRELLVSSSDPTKQKSSEIMALESRAGVALIDAVLRHAGVEFSEEKL